LFNPKPITNGFNTTPFFCNAAETAHGSPLHSSIPSVIKMIIFLDELFGKSFPHSSSERAIGVVPLGLISSSLYLIL